MTTVPPPSTPTPQITATPPAAPVSIVLQPPPAIAALTSGAVFEAVVVPAPPPEAGTKPNVILRTPHGDVAVRLPVQLPDNARVALEVLRAAAKGAPQDSMTVTVRVVTVDGQPAAQVLQQLARQALESRAAPPLPLPLVGAPALENPLLRATVLLPGAAWVPQGPQPITALGTISAFVIQTMPAASGETAAATPPPAASSAPAAATTAYIPPPGAELSVRVTGLQLPVAATAAPQTPNALALVPPPSLPGTLGSAAVTPTVGSPPPLAPAAQTPLPGPSPMAAALPLSATPQPGLALPGTQGLGPPPPQPPLTVQSAPILATINGVVTALSSGGAPIVDTDAGQVQLNVRANLPVGSRVSLEVTAQLDPRPGSAMAAPTPVSALPLSGPAGLTVGWPTLSEALSLMQRVDPQAAQQMAQAIPDGGPRTAAALISFAQAMRNGDARQWPGDSSLRALERSGPRGTHLATQLSDEVAALSSRTRETGTEWRALPVPWNADGHIERIALITRREGEDDDDSKKKVGGGGTRFLINLDLSRLGSMQLDGMFRRQTRGFDLMIRTKEPLSDRIRLDLTGIFAASNAAMGLKGSLTFQIVKKFADPLAQTAGNPDKSGLWV